MKKIVLSIFAMGCAIALFAQNVDLRGDSIRIFKNGGNAELVIRNKTRDSTGGILMNTGNGVTQYKRSRAISPTQFTVGGDTITFGGAAAGLQQVLDVSNVVDTFNLRRSDSTEWLFMRGDTMQFNNWSIFRGAGFLQFKSDTVMLLQPGNAQVLSLSALRNLLLSPLAVGRSGVAQIAMLQAHDANGEFDTGIYGEVSGGVQATKWAGTFFAVGGVNNYGIEPGALSGSGINAAVRITQPATWAPNDFAIRSLSLAQSFFSGPVGFGVNGPFPVNQFQIENWGSMGLVSDSIPTVDPYDFGTKLLGIDTTFGPAMTQVFKVKLTNGILGPTVSTLGTNVTGVTFSGHDDAFDMVVTTSGNVTGLICTFVFGQTWDTFPYMSSPGFGSDAATMAATTKCGIWATSTAGGRSEGTITGAGTYHYNIIVHR